MMAVGGKIPRDLCLIAATCMCLVLGQMDNEVAVKWGVADSYATVGRLFRMHIPSDAFKGNVLSYSVQSADGSPLPGWLEFDFKDNVLQGIPEPKDAGQLYLEISAKGTNNLVPFTFKVLVRDIPSHTSGTALKFKPSGPEFVHCKQKEPETVATIIIDADNDKITVSERIGLLKKFLHHMDLEEEMVKMLPVGNSPMHDTSALVSGTGDSVAPQTPGLFISWPVGCGQVKEGHFPVLQRLDDDSGNGRMKRALGYPIVGWHVSNTHIQAPSRKRRQALATATPVITPVMPTKTDTSGGKTDDGEDQMTHKMVDMESPSVMQPTATQPPMEKTDEPFVPPIDEADKSPKVVPAETSAKMPPVEKTKVMPEIKPTKTYDVGEPTDVPVIVTDDCIKGQKPSVNKDLPRLNYQVGNVIDYVIPAKTFEDCETGGTRGLKLMLFRETTETIPKDFFLQFDAAEQKIVGLPTEKDVGKYKMNLVANKKGMLANVDFTILIKAMKGKRKINHELSVAIDYDYNTFMANVGDRIDLANRVASVYGDSDASNLIITKTEPGSVIYGWANKTLSSNDCPSEDISKLAYKLVNKDGTLNEKAIEKMKPFTLLSASAQPAGSCEGDPSFPAIVSKPLTKAPDTKDVSTSKPTMKPAVDGTDDTKQVDSGEKETKPTDKPDETTDENVAKGSKGGDDDDDFWITTVVPAVVIVVILLIALFIACILYRKKRKGKMNVEEQNTFVNKGAPVIFPDELEDKPGDVNKPLLVEGSPAPPEYHRGTSESPEPHQGNNQNNHRNNTNNVGTVPNDDGITEMPERPYDPPPPVTASSNNKQPRPTHQQQPFSQPPQILP